MAEGALSPTGTRKIPRSATCHPATAIVASSLYLLHRSLADSKSKPLYQKCPASQPLQHGKKLNKAGIGLRTRRDCPARTRMQTLSHPRPPSSQARDGEGLLTSGQREKIVMLKVKAPQRYSPARSHYSEAHSQQKREFSPLKEPTIPSPCSCKFFKRSQILYILICFKKNVRLLAG